MMKRRVAVVSADLFLREMLLRAVDGLGAELHAAVSVGELVPAVRRLSFDLVIVVSAAPFFSGCDPVRMLRREGLRRPVIYVVSWQQSEQTVLSLLECGVDQYLTLPLNLVRLRRKVANELNRCL